MVEIEAVDNVESGDQPDSVGECRVSFDNSLSDKKAEAVKKTEADEKAELDKKAEAVKK